MLKFISSGSETLGFEEAIRFNKVVYGINGEENIPALIMDLYGAIKAGFSFRSFFTGEAEKEASSMIREIATELYDKLENSNQPTSVDFISYVLNPTFTGKLRIKAFDKKYRFSFKLE